MCISHVELDENKKILKFDANTFYGWAMIQSLPNDHFFNIQIEILYSLLKNRFVVG